MKEGDFIKYEFIGGNLEVVESKNKSLVGLKGKIIDETKNMFVLDNGKKLVKDQSIFHITINEETFEVKGDLLVGRHEKRLSKIQVHIPDSIEVKEGDIVKIAECRPLSKTKHFVIIENESN